MHRNFKNIKTYVAIACFCVLTVASAFAQSDSINSDNSTSYDTQNKIQGIFNNIETIGNTYNSGGTKAAAKATMDAGCRAALEQFLQTHLFADIKDGLLPSDLTGDTSPQGMAKSYLTSKTQELGQSTFNSLCAAVQGDKIESVNIEDYLKKGVRNDLIPRLAALGQNLAQGTGLPFLSRLELQTGVSDKHLFSSVTSVQPLWKDNTEHHHVFAQVSWYNTESNKTDLGYNKQYDTINAGLAYRYLTTDKNYLYGANVFFDHAPKMNHNRMSVGVDARTSQLAFSANRYFPISDWRKLDLYYEEKATAGWDTQLRGQIPSLPSWTASVKGYEWDKQDDGKNLFGLVSTLEYSPVPALAVSVGVRDESQSSPSLEAALRFNYQFDKPADLQFRERTALAPVSDYVYEKVQRENIIRVKQQRREDSKLTVIQTTGSNIAVQSTGTSSLSVGQLLLMPVTVTVSNTVGDIARLRFADGSVLTIAQNSQVTIVPNQITLVSGTMQYVNNGAVQTVIVPGGTITLHGTDIDVVSNGTNSSVRVRDGSVDFVGSTSGSATLGVEDAAESIAGVIGTLTTVSANYITHTDAVSTRIDRIAPPQSGEKVTPYPYETPRVISSNMSVGGTIILGLRFNDDVVVSSGTPRLLFTINGHSRVATYLSGSGSDDLRFTYTNVGADISATSLTVNGFDKNGATIRGNGKDAVTTIADATLSVTGSGDSTAPSGYSVVFTSDPINDANVANAAFTISSAEVGATYDYSITSSGGGTTVTGNGTITSVSQTISGINVSGLGDGTLTLSLTLTDPSFNTGIAATDTVFKNTTAPSGYTVSFTTNPVNNANKAAAALSIATAEVGSTYSYTITDGTITVGPFTGTVTAVTQPITGINLTTLADTTLTVSLTLTDTGSNVGTAVTNTVVKDVVAPTITSITPPANATYEP